MKQSSLRAIKGPVSLLSVGGPGGPTWGWGTELCLEREEEWSMQKVRDPGTC